MRNADPLAAAESLARLSVPDQLFLAREELWQEMQPVVERLAARYFAGDPTAAARLPGLLHERFRALPDEYDPARSGPPRPWLVRELTSTAVRLSRQRAGL